MHCVLLQMFIIFPFFTIDLVKITSIKVTTYPKKSSSRLSTYKVEDKQLDKTLRILRKPKVILLNLSPALQTI